MTDQTACGLVAYAIERQLGVKVTVVRSAGPGAMNVTWGRTVKTGPTFWRTVTSASASIRYPVFLQRSQIKLPKSVLKEIDRVCDELRPAILEVLAAEAIG
jgi:hypothetical protein